MQSANPNKGNAMIVNRENLLAELESVAPGLSPKEIVEQSSCYGFQNGIVMTYNDQIACRRKCSLQIEGAVPAAPLLALLQKLSHANLDMDAVNGELLVNAKRENAGIRMEKEVLSPIKDLEQPTEWTKLHKNFSEAVDMASQTAGTNEEKFSTTCVNIHPKWVEATDNFQITRYRLDTGFAESTRVKHSSIQHIVTLGMTRFALTKNWVHFKNKEGLILSCRRYLDQFPDLSPYLVVDGTPTTLPKSLSEAADKAEIFASDDPQHRHVTVELWQDNLRLRGRGEAGWYKKLHKVKYDGEPIAFYIASKLLVQITQKHNEVFVAKNRLKVEGPNYIYLTVLGKVGKDGKPVKKAKSKEQDSE